MSRSYTVNTQTLANTTTVVAPGNAGTMAIWLNPNNNAGSSTGFILCAFAKSSATAGQLQIQHFIDNNFYLGWAGGGFGDQRLVVADTGLFTAGTWAHHALTWNTSGTTTTYYVNGVQKGTTNSFPASTFTCDQVGAGNWPPAVVSQGNVPGKVADFATWSVVLTAGELSSLANGARPIMIRPKSLIVYWPLDGIESPEPDLSGNIVNASVSGPVADTDPPLMLFTPRWPIFSPSVAAAAHLDRFFLVM